MNLHAIVGNSIAQINPYVLGNYQQSSGYTTNDDGSRVPSYYPGVTVQIQMQALQYNDIMQISSLNVQGTRQAMYINGDWEGLVRVNQQGGDIITLPDNSIWLVVMVLERWSVTSGWCKVAVTRQD